MCALCNPVITLCNVVRRLHNCGKPFYHYIQLINTAPLNLTMHNHSVNTAVVAVKCMYKYVNGNSSI